MKQDSEKARRLSKCWTYKRHKSDICISRPHGWDMEWSWSDHRAIVELTKDTLIAHPHGWAMGCLLWLLGWTLVCVIGGFVCTLQRTGRLQTVQIGRHRLVLRHSIFNHSFHQTFWWVSARKTNSIANAVELRLFCTNPSSYCISHELCSYIHNLLWFFWYWSVSATVKLLIWGAPNPKTLMILILSCSWLCSIQ